MVAPLQLDLFLDALVERLAPRVADEVARRAGAVAVAPPEADGRLLTVAEVASRLGVSKGGVYKLAERGTLSSVKIGRRLRFRPVDVDALVSGGARVEARVIQLARAARAGHGR